MSKPVNAGQRPWHCLAGRTAFCNCASSRSKRDEGRRQDLGCALRRSQLTLYLHILCWAGGRKGGCILRITCLLCHAPVAFPPNCNMAARPLRYPTTSAAVPAAHLFPAGVSHPPLSTTTAVCWFADTCTFVAAFRCRLPTHTALNRRPGLYCCFETLRCGHFRG